MASLVVGNKSTGEGAVNGVGTLTHSHTVAAGTNRILFVTVGTQDVANTPDVTGVTYNGVAMTLVTNSKRTHTWEDGYIYYLINPATGANNVVVTIGSAGENANVIVGCADYSNHDGNAPVGNFSAIASSATAVNTGSIPYTDGDVIVAITVNGINGRTVSWTNATEWFDEAYSSMGAAGAAYTASGSGNVTITATHSSTSDRILITAARISPLAAPTVAATTSIKPGSNLSLTLTNWSSAPTTVTYNGVTEAFSGTPTTSAATMLAIPLSDFAPSQHHAATNFLTNYTLTLSNGSESASATVQVDPDKTDSEDIGAAHATNWFTAIVAKPSGLATGDTTFGFWHNGDGVRDETIQGTIESGTGWFAAITRPAFGRLMAFGLSANTWLTPQDTEEFEPEEHGAMVENLYFRARRLRAYLALARRVRQPIRRPFKIS